MIFRWELIDDEYGDESTATYRAKVIGGWVLKTKCDFDNSNSEIMAIVFIPDPSHKWKIEKESKTK